MKKTVNRRFIIEFSILVLTGILLWFLTSRNMNTPRQNILPDILFTVGSIFMIRGIITLLSRSHAFTHTSDSFRFVHRLYRGKKAEDDADTAVPRTKKTTENDRRSVAIYFIIAGILIAASVLTGLL